MSDSIDYARVANLYDTYVRTTFDVPFFLEQAKKTSGQVLELMSGTGRVSLPLIEAGVQLTCVDRSREMLSVLRSKLRQRGLAACTHLADVRDLDLEEQFELIIIPFHAFSELTSPGDQQKTLNAIHRHLTSTGRFICTLHNPPVRLKRVDGHLRLWGKFPLDQAHGLLLLWGQEEFASDGRTVDLLEFLEEYDAYGVMRARTLLEVAYYPFLRAEFERLAQSSGFRVVALFGNYDHAEFQDETSPYMIWVLEKAKAS